MRSCFVILEISSDHTKVIMGTNKIIINRGGNPEKSEKKPMIDKMESITIHRVSPIITFLNILFCLSAAMVDWASAFFITFRTSPKKITVIATNPICVMKYSVVSILQS